MESFLEDLNESQQKPVRHLDGPLMIIAGAGSGKTRVLTYRIAHLIKQGISPHNILALTFTNKAAREMKKRISSMVGDSTVKSLWMGTFHSIFAKILRIEAERLGYPRNFSILDTQDSHRVINAIIKEKQLNKEVYKYKQIYARISNYKNNLITVKAYFESPELIEHDTIAKRPRMGEIYREYTERCFRSGCMDFDDLLLKTNELLTVFPEVLAYFQEKFKYIMVDEYQDTNHSQYLIVRALSDRYQNICVVGDDSQSIYAFRGANINNILNFKKDFNDVSIYRLEQNYRSTKNIVEASNTLIKHNQNRLEKTIWTHNDHGSKILVHGSISDAEEGRFVAQSIWENVQQQGGKYGDYAVLYRTNAQSRSVEDALRKLDIPYQIYGGLSFYQRREVKDIIAYCRLIINYKDDEALTRIINLPTRGIGQTTIDKLVIIASHYKRSIFEVLEKINVIDTSLNTGIKARLENFVNLIKALRVEAEEKDAFEVVGQLIRRTGLLLEFKKDTTPENISRVENLESLVNGIKDFVDTQKANKSEAFRLADYIEEIALISDLDKESKDENRVTLMTVHLSKGLEFSKVYIVGMEENLFPSAMSSYTKPELEEERRLFYVALTRAEKQVWLTYAEHRSRWGKFVEAEPSRFLSEIDEQLITYLTTKKSDQYQPKINGSNFSKRKLRQTKPINRIDKKHLYKQVERAEGHLDKNNNAIAQHFVVNDAVVHERFGKGIIKKIEGYGQSCKLEISFEKGGIKKILLRFTKLQKI